MKLDLLYEIDAPKPWDEAPHPYGQRQREQRAYRECIEQVKLADNYGFNTVWFVEHHFREGRSHCPAPEVVIGALTQATKNIRLGFGVTLLPYGFTHPIRVAEKVAAADVSRGGRVEWGTGRSTPMEQTAFHVDRVKSRDEWKEAIEIIVEAWKRSASRGTRRRSSSPSASSRPSRSRIRTRRLDGGDVATTRARSRAALGSACCRSRSCSRST